MRITRFAPSLTGHLHLGHVLHMLHVWGIARLLGGRVVSRIEDHDLSRRRPEYERDILETMDWLGFVPDQGITLSNAGHPSDYRQSDCADHYAAVLETLKVRGLVYGCECSRKEVAASQPDGSDELCYRGACAAKGLPLEGNTVRLRVPPGEVVFQDRKLGECRQTPQKQCGDFSLRDRNGLWTYQFCCVCDDIRHGINLVIRGEDILPSTGRQIQLFRILGHPEPEYHHHPLICDAAGNKLSKRQRSESIARLREAGATPEEVIGKTFFEAGWATSFEPLAATSAIEKYIA